MTSPQLAAGGRLELRQRRRRRRLRLVVAAVVVLAVAAAAFAVYLAAEDPVRPQTAVAKVRTQSTLLLQVQAPDQTAVASALLAADPDTQTGAVLLVPSQVLVNVPGIGSLPLDRALGSAPPHGSRDALSDLMGVTVDEGWVLSTAQLTELIDVVGGIPVEVDVPVVVDSSVLLDVGPQRVDGARALQLLQYLAPDEQEQSRLARLQEVLDGVLSSLPAERAKLLPVLQSLGAESGATLAPSDLADYLLDLRTADGEGQLQYDSLPVLPIDTGGGVSAFRIDAPKLIPVVDRLLADSVPSGVREGGNRVLVLNGVGTPGLGEAVRAKLAPAGFVFVGSRNAPEFGHPETRVLVQAPTVEAQALGERVATAIGVPITSVVTQDFGTVADVLVLVGADFRP